MRTGLDSTSDKSRYAHKLIELILKMAEMKCNIILELLDPSKPVIYEKQYPEKPIVLDTIPVCIYYHAHEKNKISDEEHGHFHFFLKSNQKDNTSIKHLAALSIDCYGQPYAWFTVNKWVTADVIYDSQHFKHVMNSHINNEEEEGAILRNWLLNMLQFYQDEITQLMDESREKIDSFRRLHEKSTDSIYEDRTIYFLGKKFINLTDDLG